MRQEQPVSQLKIEILETWTSTVSMPLSSASSVTLNGLSITWMKSAAIMLDLLK